MPNPISIYQALQNIVEASQTQLYLNDFGFNSMPPNPQFPLFGYKLTGLKEVLRGNDLQLDYSLRLVIWEKFPSDCETFDEILKATEVETQAMRTKLKAIILLLEQCYGFERIENTQGAIDYKIRRNSLRATEHQLFGVFADVTLRRCEAENCCIEIEFDLEQLTPTITVPKNWLGQ